MGKTFGRSSDIDESGDLYFRNIAAGKWTPRRREPDVFIDYEIEMRPHGEPNGLTAYIQLKSRQSVVFRNGLAKVSMERKHLEYYQSKSLRPVFIVLIDVGVQRGYYVFAQEWLRVTGGLQKKANVKTLSIDVREADRIDDLPRFERSLRLANLYLREMYPSTPQAAIEEVARRIREKDPRVRAIVNADSEGTYATIIPVQDIEFKLSLKDGAKEAAAKLAEFVAYGKSVSLSGADLTLSGSPLLEGEPISHRRRQPQLPWCDVNAAHGYPLRSGDSRRGECRVEEIPHDINPLTRH